MTDLQNKINILYDAAVDMVEAGQPANAIALYSEALDLDSSNVDIRYDLAKCLASLGEHLKAIDHYLIALQSEPHAVDILQNAGTSYGEVGDLKSFVKYLEAAHSQDPENLNVTWTYISSLQKIGDLEKAIQVGEAVIDASAPCSERVDLQLQLAETLDEVGRSDESVHMLESIVKESPKCWEAHQTLAFLAALSEDYVRAIRYSHKMFRYIPRDPTYYPIIARSLQIAADNFVKISNYRNAARYLRLAIRFDPEFIEAHADLGRALAQLGAYEQAGESYRHALKLPLREDFRSKIAYDLSIVTDLLKLNEELTVANNHESVKKLAE